jgi:hypothetical protein
MDRCLEQLHLYIFWAVFRRVTHIEDKSFRLYVSYGKNREEMYWSQDILHKVFCVKWLIGEKIAHVQSRHILEYSDSHL